MPAEISLTVASNFLDGSAFIKKREESPVISEMRKITIMMDIGISRG